MHSNLLTPNNPLANKATDSVLVLPESSATLELLLQYMYNQPQPDLSEVAFPVLLALAEAAEKYQVYAALEICKVYLRCAVKSYMRIHVS